MTDKGMTYKNAMSSNSHPLGFMHETLANGIVISTCLICMKSIGSPTPTTLRMAEEKHPCGSHTMNPMGGNELMMVFDRIVAAVLPGTIIPKPHATKPVQLKGIGQRRGEDALIYSVPNDSDPSQPYQKGVTRSELEQAYCELRRSKSISRAWFNRELQAAAAEGGCNFTTIGGLFQLIGDARYSSIGRYEWTKQESGGCSESERMSNSHVAAAAHLSKSWLRGRTPRGR